jgi:hypothetical protein
MRKRIISPVKQETTFVDQDWLNLDELVEVEMTSENEQHPVEAALMPDRGAGWRATGPGEQTIRLIFASPQKLQRICLSFMDIQVERTQQYVLRWSSDGGQSFQEIVRQQWNFSPEGANSEVEEHCVDLAGVTVLELEIIPDINGGNAIASLAQLRLA